MSEARKLGEMCPLQIEQMLTEMLEGNHDDNEVLLGTLLSEGKEIQVQIKLTCIEDDFLEDLS